MKQPSRLVQLICVEVWRNEDLSRIGEVDKEMCGPSAEGDIFIDRLRSESVSIETAARMGTVGTTPKRMRSNRPILALVHITMLRRVGAVLTRWRALSCMELLRRASVRCGGVVALTAPL